MSQSEPLGRRERKKAVTRAAIVDAATRLFLERGFDNVTVREIAEEADVSPTTVFAHFPHKEALVFSEEDVQHDRLSAVVKGRPPGTSISAALREHFGSELDTTQSDARGVDRGALLALIDATPILHGYASQMWLRREDVLGEAIADVLGLPQPTDEIRIYARFALQIQLLASGSPDSAATLDAGFRILDQGWDPAGDATH